MKRKYFLLTILCISLLSACQIMRSEGSMEFHYSTSEPTNHYIEKTLSISEHQDKVKIDAELSMDEGEVTLQVVSNENKAIVWEETYNRSTDFSITLKDMDAGEFIIKLQTTATKNVDLVLTFDNSLTKTEKPSHPQKNL